MKPMIRLSVPLPMTSAGHLFLLRAALAAGVALLTACASPTHRAPVEVRQATGPAAQPAGAAAPSAAVVVAPDPVPARPLPPGAENAGKPGYYTVKPGDTLLRVSLEHGQNWRDVARWNNLDNPNVLVVGQVLRVVPPAPAPTVASAQPVTPSGRVETRPLDAAAPSAVASSPAPAPASPAPDTGRDAGDEPPWLWPAAGPVVTPFDENKSKGLAIAGKAGDPVVAAADGRVVYAGAGLRGYGNLVIVKHNATYLTAYAHNQALLVKEDQVVRRGQKIAEMGSSDADRVQLHFEIRRQGKPVDPAALLPAR